MFKMRIKLNNIWFNKKKMKQDIKIVRNKEWMKNKKE